MRYRVFIIDCECGGGERVDEEKFFYGSPTEEPIQSDYITWS